MGDWIFNILLAVIAITSIIHLIGMNGSAKRLERNTRCLERWIELMEKQDRDNNGD